MSRSAPSVADATDTLRARVTKGAGRTPPRSGWRSRCSGRRGAMAALQRSRAGRRHPRRRALQGRAPGPQRAPNAGQGGRRLTVFTPTSATTLNNCSPERAGLGIRTLLAEVNASGPGLLPMTLQAGGACTQPALPLPRIKILATPVGWDWSIGWDDSRSTRWTSRRGSCSGAARRNVDGRGGAPARRVGDADRQVDVVYSRRS
jgi:hypothetical protein